MQALRYMYEIALNYNLMLSFRSFLSIYDTFFLSRIDKNRMRYTEKKSHFNV